MLVGPKAVCAGCHEAGTAGAKTATQMAQWIDNLDSALQKSEDTLAQAEKEGMEVSEAQVRLLDGREDLVKARLAMHTFQPEQMHKPIEAGMAIANETLQSGQTALRDEIVRRRGLAISVFFIAITVAAIWFLIRRIEADGSGYVDAAEPK